MVLKEDVIERSITKLEALVGHRIEVMAYGISYLGILASVDYDRGTLQLQDGNDTVTLELEHVESYCLHT